MEPAHTPFPTPTNLPFQFAAGIQTSKRMSESDVGRIVPPTRQKAGNREYAAGGAPGPPAPAPAGGVNAPAGTVCATVISVWASSSPLSSSHPAAWAVEKAARPAA